MDLDLATSGSGSRSGSAWSDSTGSGSVWPPDPPPISPISPSLASALSLNLDPNTDIKADGRARSELAGLGLGLEMRESRLGSSVNGGLGLGNLITRRRASVTDQTAEKQGGAEEVDLDGSSNALEEPATSTQLPGRSSWFSALRRYFTPAGSGFAFTRTAVPSGRDEDAGQKILRDPIRPGRASSRKTRRRREGDEQDIAGLGKSRGRRVGRQVAQGGDEGQQEEPLGNGNNTNTTATNETNATTTNHLATPLPLAPTSAVPLNTSFPLPLDSTLSYSLGNSCVAFLTGFLTSDEMAGKNGEEGRCKPFGLLHGASSGWAGM